MSVSSQNVISIMQLVRSWTKVFWYLNTVLFGFAKGEWLMKSPAPSRPQKMALIPACIFLCFAALSVQAEETSVTPQPPDILLGPLFNDVQNAKLFPDQKTFADAVPNSDPLMILADYRMQQNQSGFDLRHFVNVNFTLPKEARNMFRQRGNHCANILTDFGRY